MGYTGRAVISRTKPRALGVCDRCGQWYNHDRLNWQWDWRGPRLVNERILTCEACNDKPFEHNRTIVLPPDPVPITNPRPEAFTEDNNPISPLNWDPLANAYGAITANGNIGNLTERGGIDAPFMGAMTKAAHFSAYRTTSLLGPNNYVGKSWGLAGMTVEVPPALSGQVPAYAIYSFILQAPSDAPFLASGAVSVAFEGWDGSAWQSLWTGTTTGAVGETLTASNLTATAYFGHRILFTGDGSALAVSGLSLSAGAAAELGVETTTP